MTESSSVPRVPEAELTESLLVRRVQGAEPTEYSRVSGVPGAETTGIRWCGTLTTFSYEMTESSRVPSQRSNKEVAEAEMTESSRESPGTRS